MRLGTFGEFYEACRDRLTDGQLRDLNARSEYFELEGCWVGLHQYTDGIWLNIVVGDVRGLLRLKRALLGTSMRYIGWECRKDSPAWAWAKYWQAHVEDVGRHYPDGEIAWRVLVDMHRQQRQQVNKEMVELAQKV